MFIRNYVHKVNDYFRELGSPIIFIGNMKPVDIIKYKAGALFFDVTAFNFTIITHYTKTPRKLWKFIIEILNNLLESDSELRTLHPSRGEVEMNRVKIFLDTRLLDLMPEMEYLNNYLDKEGYSIQYNSKKNEFKLISPRKNKNNLKKKYNGNSKKTS